LSSVVPKYRVEQVILCIPSPPRELLRRIWAASELLGVKVKIVPTLEEILGRKINIPNFRNIEMNDLLGRKPVEKVADDPAMVAAYAGKRILITGAGGSIGSELAVQLSKAGPAALLLLDKDENGLNDTFSHLEKDARTRASAVVPDLRFAERLRGVLQTSRPEVVFQRCSSQTRPSDGNQSLRSHYE